MTRAPIIRLTLDPSELVVDNFAGGGGASTGIGAALGRDPDYAINHDAEALALHAANHPKTVHMREDVFKVDPVALCAGRGVGLAWFSPDCTHFSKAKGGKPVSRKRRGLAWVVIRWATLVRPRVIAMENVEEFKTWGPLKDGRPDVSRTGKTFRAWVNKLRKLGYVVEWRELRACDYGAPTSRKRLFLIARCDGQPIVWPNPTHGPRRAPYRTAAECIDWTLPCPSIFERKRPLAEATLRRIARGIRKFVIDAREPFIVPLTHHGGENRAYGVSQPMPTITCAHRGEFAVVAPTIARVSHGDVDKNGKRRGRGEHSIEEPLPTQTASNDFALVAPTLVQTGYGEREGQAARCLDLQKPLGVVPAGGCKHALVAALLAKHYGGPNGHQTPGSHPDLPFDTITGQDHHALVAANLVKLYGTCEHGCDARDPMPTITSGGNHVGAVYAFLTAYFGNEKDGGSLFEPARTVTTKDRFALVTVHGVDYVIVDIGMRMLTPRELFNAQGFPPDYAIEIAVNGKPLSKTAQTRMCGNSVAPPAARAVVEAQFAAREIEVSA